MKKIIAIVLCAMMALSLCACGNMAVLDPGSFTFKHIHVETFGKGFCADVEKWWDNDNGIEVQTKEYGAMYLSEGTYMMFDDGDNCPYCSQED